MTAARAGGEQGCVEHVTQNLSKIDSIKSGNKCEKSISDSRLRTTRTCGTRYTKPFRNRLLKVEMNWIN